MSANINDKIDIYNKLRLLFNILNDLIRKTIANKDNDEVLNKLVLSVKSNFSRFMISKQIPDENFGILFSDMNTISQLNSKSTLTEQDSLKFLSYYEDEVRNYIKSHIGLMRDNRESEPSYEKLNLKIKQITVLLVENTKLLNDIFKTFKANQNEQKQKYIEEINKEYEKINIILSKISNYIYTTLSSEQNIKSLIQIKENLLQKQKETKEEIEVMKYQINKYISQGDEMLKLTNEYKRLCTMIDCIKNNNI